MGVAPECSARPVSSRSSLRDAGDNIDHAEFDFLGLKQGALFDVELEEPADCGRRHPWFAVREIQSDASGDVDGGLSAALSE